MARQEDPFESNGLWETCETVYSVFELCTAARIKKVGLLILDGRLKKIVFTRQWHGKAGELLAYYKRSIDTLAISPYPFPLFSRKHIPARWFAENVTGYSLCVRAMQYCQNQKSWITRIGWKMNEDSLYATMAWQGRGTTCTLQKKHWHVGHGYIWL